MERMHVVLSGDATGRLRMGSLWAATLGDEESHADSHVLIGVRLFMPADDSD